MTDVRTPDVPDLGDEWISLRRDHLLAEMHGHHGRPGLTRLAALGGLVVTASVAATVALSAGSGTPNAFAGWAAAPTAPTATELMAAETACQAPAGASQPTLTDTRGPFTMVLYATGTGTQLCLSGPSFSGRGLTGRGVGMENNPPPAGAIAVDRMAFLATDGQAYAMAEGRTGAGVAAITLTLADGTPVVATVTNGYFAAWWPGGSLATSAQVTTASGTTTQAIDHPTPPGGSAADGHVATGHVPPAGPGPGGPVSCSASGSSSSYAGSTAARPGQLGSVVCHQGATDAQQPAVPGASSPAAPAG